MRPVALLVQLYLVQAQELTWPLYGPVRFASEASYLGKEVRLEILYHPLSSYKYTLRGLLLTRINWFSAEENHLWSCLGFTLNNFIRVWK